MVILPYVVVYNIHYNYICQMSDITIYKGAVVVVGFTTTYAISSYHHFASSYLAHDEVYLIHLYVIKFVSDLRQVGG